MIQKGNGIDLLNILNELLDQKIKEYMGRKYFIYLHIPLLWDGKEQEDFAIVNLLDFF